MGIGVTYRGRGREWYGAEGGSVKGDREVAFGWVIHDGHTPAHHRSWDPLRIAWPLWADTVCRWTDQPQKIVLQDPRRPREMGGRGGGGSEIN